LVRVLFSGRDGLPLLHGWRTSVPADRGGEIDDIFVLTALPSPTPFLTHSKRLLAMRLSGIRQRLLRLLMVSQWSNKVRVGRGCVYLKTRVLFLCSPPFSINSFPQARALVEVGRVLDAGARFARAATDAADQV
jgi:hypothetical protein